MWCILPCIPVRYKQLNFRLLHESIIIKERIITIIIIIIIIIIRLWSP